MPRPLRPIAAFFLLMSLCAACSHERSGPKPLVENVDPALVCTEQFTSLVTLTGSGLSPVTVDSLSEHPELALPAVSLLQSQDLQGGSLSGGEPILVPARRLTWSSRQSMTVELGPELGLTPGVYDLQITNRNGNRTTREASLVVVPPPTLERVEPDLFCLEQEPISLTLTGTGFLRVGDDLPRVVFGDDSESTAASLDDCFELAGPVADARLCTTLIVELSQGSLTPGSYPVRVVNPAPAGCESTENVTVAVVEPPEIESLDPDLVCNAQGDEEITLSGSNFLDVDGTLPTVTAGTRDFQASGVSDCQPVEGTTIPTRTCTGLTIQIPEGSLEAGGHEVIVTNPEPAPCSSAPGVLLHVVAPPEITAVSSEPPCQVDPGALEIVGSGFLVIEGQRPLVTADGTQLSVIELGGCQDYTGPSLTTQICTSIRVAIPAGLLDIGDYQVTVRNPAPADCQTSFDAVIGLPPTLDSISPMRICETGGEITLRGSNFLEGAQVLFDDTPAEYVTYVDDTTLVAGVPPGMGGGVHDVTVVNPDGCSATLEGALQIVELPLVYYVDPPVVYNGINTQVTVFASGMVGTVIDVSIRPTGEIGPLTVLDFSFDPSHPNRILAIVLQDTAPSDYDVIVTDDVGCIAELIDGLTVTDQVTLALARIDPPFGWTDEESPVVLFAQDPVAAPDVQFAATPRAYLNPSSAGPDTVATALRSVAFVDPVRVNAIVPEDLPAGSYDLIAVNPDGAVGFLPGAFQVTALPPPVIFDITPGSVIAQPDQTVNLVGDHFRNPEVLATCRTPLGAIILVAGTVVPVSAQNLEVTFDMSTVAAGSVCVVRVTNDDETHFDYSALSVTNPSQNLSNFTAATSLNIARRAPAVAAGRPTRTARFLYVMGGDDGDPQNALSSVESAPVDPYGELGGWSMQAYPLPGPVTLAKAVTLGRFVYLVGGNDGSSAASQVLRAEILRPRDAPTITDVDIHLGDGAGLDGGVWYYRVSALFPAGDPQNPDGQSLASDPLVIQIPQRPELIEVTLVWSGVPGASGYRIFRSPTAGLTSGSEELIAEVGASPLTYTDTGQAATGEVPLPFGSLGNWAVLAPMGSAREGPGVTVAVDPLDPAVYYLYALAGRDQNGTALASYEFLPITVEADGIHTLGTWTDGQQPMSVGRWQVGAFKADHAHASLVNPGDTWIYVGSGLNSTGAGIETNVSAARVQSGGDLGSWTGVDAMTPPRAGYGYTVANSTLYAFGGQQAQATDGGVSSLIVNPLPTLDNWNNLGLAMTEPRYLPGSVTESAFIFLVGGWNGTAATATVEKTVW